MNIEERLLKHLLPEATIDYLETCKKLYEKDRLAEKTTLTEARFIEKITEKYLQDIKPLDLTTTEIMPIFEAFYLDLQKRYRRDA